MRCRVPRSKHALARGMVVEGLRERLRRLRHRPIAGMEYGDVDAMRGSKGRMATASVARSSALSGSTNATATPPAAAPLSEALSGSGESAALQRVTVNISTIDGGVSPNLVPTTARARCGIRLPACIDTGQIAGRMDERPGPLERVRWNAVQRHEPSFTTPAHEGYLAPGDGA